MKLLPYVRAGSIDPFQTEDLLGAEVMRWPRACGSSAPIFDSRDVRLQGVSALPPASGLWPASFTIPEEPIAEGHFRWL